MAVAVHYWLEEAGDERVRAALQGMQVWGVYVGVCICVCVLECVWGVGGWESDGVYCVVAATIDAHAHSDPPHLPQKIHKTERPGGGGEPQRRGGGDAPAPAPAPDDSRRQWYVPILHHTPWIVLYCSILHKN